MNLDSYCSRIRLVGSDPQIKWAASIRKRKLEDFRKLTIRHMALALKPLVSNEDLAAMNCLKQPNLIGLMFAIGKYAMSCPDAAWWIKHRDDKIAQWLPEAAKQCVDHFKTTKPFK